MDLLAFRLVTEDSSSKMVPCQLRQDGVYSDDREKVLTVIGAPGSGASSTFIHRAEWKKKDEASLWEKLAETATLKMVKRCLILTDPFEVMPGLQTLTQTQLHTLKKVKSHTLRPADGHKWNLMIVSLIFFLSFCKVMQSVLKECGQRTFLYQTFDTFCWEMID